MNLDLIAEYYDLLHSHATDDILMWKNLLQDAEGPILEIGCGTGRLLLPLAEAGHTITGLDLSRVALNATQAKVEAAGLTSRTKLHYGDMRDFDLPYKNFALAIIPLNTFMHCQETDEQLITLKNIYHHLRTNGQIIIDLFYPTPTMLAEVDGRLYFEDETVDELTDRLVQWYWRHDIDLHQQKRHLTYILDEIDKEGVVRRLQIPFTLRFIYRYEMELLLRTTNFTLQTIYGNYHLDLFNHDSSRMIFVASKMLLTSPPYSSSHTSHEQTKRLGAKAYEPE